MAQTISAFVVILSLISLAFGESFIKSPVIYRLPPALTSTSFVRLVANPSAAELYVIEFPQSSTSVISFVALNISTENITQLVSTTYTISGGAGVNFDYLAQFVPTTGTIQIFSFLGTKVFFAEISLKGSLIRSTVWLSDLPVTKQRYRSVAIRASSGELWAVISSSGQQKVVRFDTTGQFINSTSLKLLYQQEVLSLEELSWLPGAVVAWVWSATSTVQPFVLTLSGNAYTLTPILTFLFACPTTPYSTYPNVLTDQQNNILVFCNSGEWFKINGTSGATMKTDQVIKNQEIIDWFTFVEWFNNKKYVAVIQKCATCTVEFLAYSLSDWSLVGSTVLGMGSTTQGNVIGYSDFRSTFYLAAYFTESRIIDGITYPSAMYLHQMRNNASVTTTADSSTIVTAIFTTPAINNGNPRAVDSAESVVPVAVSSVAVGLIMLAAALFLHGRRIRARDKRISQDTTLHSVQTIQSVTSTIVTIQVDSQVLSIPGFLLISEDKCLKDIKKLAQGGGGSIHLVEILDVDLALRASATRAVKKYVFEESKNKDIAFHQEVAIMHYLHSKYPRFFPQLIAYDPATRAIIMPYYAAGSLHEYNPRTKRNFVFILCEIARAIRAMHSEQIAHRDLKPDNILIDVNRETGAVRPLLTDFGITKILNRDSLQVKAFEVARMNGLSVLYAAPETIRQFRDKVPVEDPAQWKTGDVYSFACILYELLCIRKPW